MGLGRISEALQDFTGGVIEMINLKTPPRDIYKVLQKAHDRHSLMGASIEVWTCAIYSSGQSHKGVLEKRVMGESFLSFFFCFLDKFTRNSENPAKWPYNWACVLHYRRDQGNCANINITNSIKSNNHKFLSLERLGTRH